MKYAKATGISFRKVERWASWQDYGLPDMRGFSPHLRTININGDFYDSILREKPDSLSEPFLWIIHDLLHIIFYDYATLNLGIDLWADKNRFIECHLASEAFAVLGLDYHYLVHTKKNGLAVDLHPKKWQAFQKLLDLPDMKSFEFCKMLTDLYLSGAGPLLELPQEKKLSRDLQNWIGHELRYSNKQRHYVVAWFEDLVKSKPSHHQAVIDDSFVAAPLWELITLITQEDEKPWSSLTKDFQAAFKSKDINFFENAPKYRKSKGPFDFRFTSIDSLSFSEIQNALKAAVKPSASSLFLFWQILTQVSPMTLSSKDRKIVQALAQASQKNKIPMSKWLIVQKLVQKLLESKKERSQPRLLSTFFLP